MDLLTMLLARDTKVCLRVGGVPPAPGAGPPSGPSPPSPEVCVPWAFVEPGAARVPLTPSVTVHPGELLVGVAVYAQPAGWAGPATVGGELHVGVRLQRGARLVVYPARHATVAPLSVEST